MFDYAHERTWLDNLKAGDKVAIRYGFDSVDVMLVTKTTTTQIHINNQKYRRKNGYRLGGNSVYSHSRIQEFTPEMQAEKEERALRRRISDVKFSTLPLDIIKQILELLPKEEKI